MPEFFFFFKKTTRKSIFKNPFLIETFATILLLVISASLLIQLVCGRFHFPLGRPSSTFRAHFHFTFFHPRRTTRCVINKTSIFIRVVSSVSLLNYKLRNFENSAARKYRFGASTQPMQSIMHWSPLRHVTSETPA